MNMSLRFGNGKTGVKNIYAKFTGVGRRLSMVNSEQQYYYISQFICLFLITGLLFNA